jgi:peptide/nickel transport system substrate-binding protein
VYETLIWYNGSSAVELVPLLATEVPSLSNGGISSDGLTYTFHLRTGVQFHDLNIMTSEDVKFSIYRLLMINDPDGPAWILGELLVHDYYDLDVTNDTQAAMMAAGIEAAISTPDANTVVFHLIAPAPYFLYCMAYTEASIVSKAYVMANGGVVNGTRNDWMATHTCGTGPFKLNIWQTGVQVILDKWANYWRTPAYFDHIYLKYISDYSARKAAFISGDADWIYIPRQNMYDFISTQSNPMPQYRVAMGYPTFTLDFLGLNQNIKFPAGAPDTIPSTFFANKNARLAMAYAYDYAKFNNDVMLGTSITPNGVIPLGMFGYDASTPTYEYNLTKAANALKQIPNPSVPGKSFADTGFTISFNYNSGNTVRETSCFLLKAGLEALTSQHLIDGTITVNVQALDWATYLAAVRGQQLGAFFLGWAPDYADPNDYTAPFLLSSGTYSRRCSINDPTLDQMVLSAAIELNPSIRADIYKQMSSYVYSQSLYIWTSQATNFHVEQRWVTGYYFNPMYSNMYYYPMGKTNAAITAPDPVTNATVSRIGQSAIRLSWIAPVNNGGSPITSYEVYRSTTPGMDKALVASVSANVTNYVDANIVVGTTYYYFVAPKNSAGVGLYSPELMSGFVVPGAFSYTATAVSGNHTMELLWQEPQDNGGAPILTYEIYRHVDLGNFSDTPYAVVPGTQRTFFDTDVVKGPTYYYAMKAVNVVGPSIIGPAVSISFTAPDAPRNLTTLATGGQINLAWQIPLYNGGYAITGFQVWRSESASFASPVLLANVTNLNYIDTTAALNKVYYYKVAAVNEVGVGAMTAAASATITVPGVPTNLVVKVNGANNITVTWGLPVSDGGSNIQYYNVYRTTSNAGIPVKVAQVTVGSVLAYVDTSIAKGTTYNYWVSAVNAAGEGQNATASGSVAADDSTMLIVAGVIIALIIIVAIVYFVMKGKKPKAPATKPEQKK